jgi:CMP-N-acetylneuraminic acid synthetase/quercetin dioxygenase-like cupin family protein
MKIIGMIPARMSSKRVSRKNLRMLGGKPLIEHILISALQAKVFDEIYVNSESDEIREIALKYGVSFFKRNEEFSTDESTNDDFMKDFLEHIDCDFVVQMLPTSPFIDSELISRFANQMVDLGVDALVSVKNIQIESIYDNRPINFNPLKKTPRSQDLTPVKAYACGLMGWRRSSFLKNMEVYGAAYHGGDSTKEYFLIDGYAEVDIDTEDDFQIAEQIVKTLSRESDDAQLSENLFADRDRERILVDDGVSNNNMDSFNQEIVSINELVNKYGGQTSWSHTVVNSESNCATLIAQMPGEGNRRHFHPDWDEWWYIISGSWEWNIEGDKKIVSKGDLVFIPRGKWHKITAIGSEIAIRLAVSRHDVDHVYASE